MTQVTKAEYGRKVNTAMLWMCVALAATCAFVFTLLEVTVSPWRGVVESRVFAFYYVVGVVMLSAPFAVAISWGIIKYLGQFRVSD